MFKSKAFTNVAGWARQARSLRRIKRAWLLRAFWLWWENGTTYVCHRAMLRLRGAASYKKWILTNDELSADDIAKIYSRIDVLPRTRFSIVMLIQNATLGRARVAIGAISKQLYPQWELYIVHDQSIDSRLLLEPYINDARVSARLRNDQECVIPAVNESLIAARGDFVIIIDHNDILAQHALYMLVEEISTYPNVDIVYTDEDKIDDRNQRSSVQFKTDWNPDLFLSQNYLGNFVAYRRDIVAKTRGLRSGVAGCELYDLTLRAIEHVPLITIRHASFVLNHRYLHAGDVSEEATKKKVSAQRRALQEHLDRVGVRGNVEVSRSGENHRVRRMLPEFPPRVSIIIPTRNHLDLLRGTIESILANTDYPDYEIIVVDNQTNDPEALSYLAQIASWPNIRVLRFDYLFNYSSINNYAVQKCQSPILAFLNNDLHIINGGWLSEMVSHALRPEVGAVGAMLYYPDDMIQHAGIIVGIGNAAANCYNGLRRGDFGYFWRTELVQNYSAVTGACLVTRADVFAEIGGFNEQDLPVAFNDVDYCLRLRERGYLITWTPYAELYHLESASRGDDMARNKIERFRREQRYFAERWAAVLHKDPYYNLNLSLEDGAFRLALKSRVRRPWQQGL